ncbi:hypothetical protein DEJ51_17735 [Streptomyces venezuelae]|uniref:Uncharacterized protein n=1 Tax=Streptomyces venezuelae TaxID=54571 RepID=A0A5P2DL07_STRVZ|nr:hypothetical protein DEJ51_17735 [Streptomyces venezuelae]
MAHAASPDGETGGTPPVIAHVVPAHRDLVYDHLAGQMLLPVEVVLSDGSTAHSVLRVGPSRVELLSIQLGQAIDRRQKMLDDRVVAS